MVVCRSSHDGVPGSRQNGGLQVAAGWRSPGRRRMEVSRSPQDGGLQVTAGLQVIAVGWRSLWPQGEHRVEVFIG